MQKKYTLCQSTMVKILKGAAIAGGAAFSITFLQEMSQVDMGQYTEVSVAMMAIIINAIKEYVKGK